MATSGRKSLVAKDSHDGGEHKAALVRRESESDPGSAGPERDSKGRYLPGHPPDPKSGRPPGAISIVTKDLRRQILAGFDKRGIAGFVEDLLHDSPAAAAALLSRLLPPEANDEEGAAVIAEVIVTSIPQGHYVMPEDLGVSSFLYTAEEVQEIQQVQGRARERADELKRKFLGDPVPDAAPDDGMPNGA